VSRRSLGILAGLALFVLAGAGIAGVVVLGVGGGPGVAGPAPHFVDETVAAGVAQTYDGPYPYAVGGGVAVFDCDDDGRPDIFLAGGSGPAILYRNQSVVGGALRFAANHDAVTDLTGVTGAYPLDVDGDGVTDLAILRDGENVLLRGLGGCRFERANERWRIDGGREFTTAFSATWEGKDALPTLAFGNYLVDADNPDPEHLCSDNELVRPSPDGSQYGNAIPLTPSWCTLSMLFSDWDRSGRRDLRVSNDRHYYSDVSDGQEQLWRIVPGESPRLYTADDGWVAVRIWGMGIASYDLTGDGYPEVYLTSQVDNRLQTLMTGPGQPTYRDIALKRGVAASHPFTGGDDRPSTAWHPEFQDVNNDGFIDLFVSKGNVDAVPDYASRDPSDLFLGQPDGSFVQAADAAGIVEFDRGRGAALADFNLDGMLDLVEVKLGAPVRLWRNVGAGDAAKPASMGNWLGIRVTEPAPNRDAIGARVEVKVGDTIQRRELTVGGGHVGGQLGWVHFGLGSAGDAQVRVTWPDGQVGPWLPVKANQFVNLDRAAGDARPWSPPPG
jgi:hypothetical protein